MTSAYLMTERLRHAHPRISSPAIATANVEVPQYRALMKEAGDTPLRRQLAVADKLFLKVWLRTRWLQLGAGLAVLTLLVVLGFAVHGSWRSEFSVSVSVASIVVAIGTVACRSRASGAFEADQLP